MSVFSSVALLKEWVVGKFYNNGQYLITGQDAQDGFANVIDTLAALVVPGEYPFEITNDDLSGDDYHIDIEHNLDVPFVNIVMKDSTGNLLSEVSFNPNMTDNNNIRFTFNNDIGSEVYSGKIIAR